MTVLSVASSGLTVALRVTSSPTVIVRVDLSRVTPVTATGELEAVTLTEQVAFLPPSAVVAMMVALPTPLPVTVPLSSTVAMAESLVAQLTFLLVALDGSIVATRVWLSPTPIVMDDLSSFMPVTATEDPDEVTLTEQVAFLLPSAVVAMMVALPTPLPVTLPSSSTEAMDESLEVQLTFLLVALDGSMLATMAWVSPTPMVIEVLSREMPVTATVLASTVTVMVAVTLPSLDVMVMVAVPGPTAVTTPFLSTVTTEVSLEVKVMPSLEASLGDTVKLMVALSPSLTVRVALLTVMSVTGISEGSGFLHELTDRAATPSTMAAKAVITLVLKLLWIIVY